jgi:acetyl-CoA C-acetyltransferase
VLASRLPDSVPAVTIDRQCGSSQQAVQFAAQAVMSGTQDVVIAAGVESMSRVPMGSNYTLHTQAGLGGGPFSARIQHRYGVADFSQFPGAQMIADRYGLTRADLDAFALDSHRKAAAATLSGAFDAEILPMTVPGGMHRKDEGIRYDATLESIGADHPHNRARGAYQEVDGHWHAAPRFSRTPGSVPITDTPAAESGPGETSSELG